ncbi:MULTISPECIES: 2OG-Fe(II) oxygenase [Sulfurimonas]|uniref:2OG-Fe(II) oxygenase n=1 Tax=Sulfurimonas TaxID=202746 RepID=UPI0012654F26|nr:2OG-Fe(II) oxygenase [Sulfurimonas indica]
MEILYEKITDALVNEGYIIIEDALDKELSQKLLQKAQKQQNYKEAGISSSNTLHLDKKRRRDKIVWLDEDGESVSEFLTFASGLREYLNRSLFLGLTYYEAHFAHYEKGDFYEKHLDAFKNSKNRVVTTVYYLNEEWNQRDGGELLIYDKEDKLIKKVLPKQNTLVVFMSEEFPHAVDIAKKDRYSIAGWYRIDK